MEMTPQTYFAKLVDVQLDVAAMWGRTAELPSSFYDEIHIENIERRHWKHIANHRTVKYTPDPPTPENLAKLQNFYDRWLAAVAVFKEHQLSAAQLETPNIARDVQRLKIDIAYDFSKAHNGRSAFDHYVNNSFSVYSMMPGLSRDVGDDLVKFGSKLSHKGRGKTDEILRQIESEETILKSDDPEQLAALHDRILTAIEAMKQVRMQTEYDMQTQYEHILSQAAPAQTAMSAAKFTP